MGTLKGMPKRGEPVPPQQHEGRGSEAGKKTDTGK